MSKLLGRRCLRRASHVLACPRTSCNPNPPPPPTPSAAHTPTRGRPRTAAMAVRRRQRRRSHPAPSSTPSSRHFARRRSSASPRSPRPSRRRSSRRWRPRRRRPSYSRCPTRRPSPSARRRRRSTGREGLLCSRQARPSLQSSSRTAVRTSRGRCVVLLMMGRGGPSSGSSSPIVNLRPPSTSAGKQQLHLSGGWRRNARSADPADRHADDVRRRRSAVRHGV